MIALAHPRPDPDKEALHRYLQDFEAVENESELLERLIDCDDILPAKYAALLFLPAGSTYRAAVQLLLASWNGPFGSACDWSADFDDDPKY